MTKAPAHHGGPLQHNNTDDVTVARTPEEFLADTYAWGAILLEDGRVISLAWLRNYPGATTSRWRRWR